MIKSQWDPTKFFSRPVSAVLGAATLVLCTTPFINALRKKKG